MSNASSIAHTFVVLCVALWMAGCTADKNAGDSVSLQSETVVELYPTPNQTSTVRFHTSASWTATCSADWLSVIPQQGEGGDNTLTLRTKSINRTKSTRTAQVMIRSGSSYKNVLVAQSGKYAVFDYDRYIMDAEGGRINFGITSNLENRQELKISYMNVDWAQWAGGTRATRSGDWTSHTADIIVNPNTSSESRSAAYYLALVADDGTVLPLDTTVLYQRGVVDSYESSDYSADGTVKVLQEATCGNGIQVVLMGDGFTDRDIADGTYDYIMQRAMENLFSEEPVSSLRDYFSVYSVTAVSRHGTVGTDSKTAFSSVPSLLSTGIACDEERIKRYTRNVNGIDFQRAVTLVVVNSHSRNGVTYLYSDPVDRIPMQYAISLAAIVDDLDSELFREVVVHETIGHALAKLGDEYGYDENPVFPNDKKSALQVLHNYLWMLNVDTNSDFARVPWRAFENDMRFSNENIGVYEGAYTYMSGIYRPTEESMMRSNRSPFNAPSRKVIYERVMYLGEGRQNVTMDEFAAFDAEHKPTRWNYSTTRSLTPWQPQHFAPPVLRGFP